MFDLSKINDPEYRWNNKKDLHDIMTHTSLRSRYGVSVIDYEALRCENDSKIQESTNKDFDWNRLKSIIDKVSLETDKTKQKTAFQPSDRLHFEERDHGECFVCKRINKYRSGKSHLHHIVPNGNVTDDNIITVCVTCHQVIHLLLFISGKWKYARPL